MRISKEVIDQLIIGTQCVPPDYNKTAQATIQAYLSEIWIRFDAEDESTWPTEEARYYFVQLNSGLTDVFFWYIHDPDNFEGWLDVKQYLFPTADILPKEDK